jgi:putative autoinducer-2 (AI-2) aldolase
MGRNIFQSTNSVNMIKAVNAIVHKNATPKEAFEVFKAKKK